MTTFKITPEQLNELLANGTVTITTELTIVHSRGGAAAEPTQGSAAAEPTQGGAAAEPTQGSAIKVIVMRHGDRSDDGAPTDNPVTNKRAEDPSLSQEGFKTASRVACDILRNQPIDKIVSSPMLRCAQTAGQVSVGIGKTSDGTFHTVNIDSSLIEVWHRKVLKVEKIQDAKLCTDKPGLPEEVTFTDFPTKLPTVEETRGIGGSADARFCEAIRNIATSSSKEGHKTVVLVTHGDCLGSAVAMMAPDKSVYEVEYCGIVTAVFDPKTGKWKLLPDECHGIGMTGSD